MKRVLLTCLATVAALTTGPALTADAAAPSAAVYDSTVSPLPPNLVSQAFQAQQTSEFGDVLTLAGTDRDLRTGTVTFSTWAKRSEWPTFGTPNGWTWPVTMNVYELADTTGTAPAVGNKIGSVRTGVAVPWRPEDTTGCADGKWAPTDSTPCYSGKAFNATFDLSALDEVPDSVVVSVAFDTSGYGLDPQVQSGPYDSLNVGLRDLTAYPATGVGSDADPDGVFTNADNTALHRVDGWGGYTPTISLTAAAGDCVFTTSGTTMTLAADCTTEESITIPAGYTLDGDGHTITAVDPSGDHFRGAVLTNAGTGTGISIHDVTVTAAGLANACDGGTDRLRGILLDGVGGTISEVTVTGVRQGASGCQEGNAIEARNMAADGKTAAAPAVRVTVADSRVSDYQKNAITFNGGVIATAIGNTVAGDGPVGYIAQNGIQVGFGASGAVSGNTITGNYYTGVDDACGVLLYQAAGVRQSKNSFSGNEKNVCNYGRGGGQGPSA